MTRSFIRAVVSQLSGGLLLAAGTLGIMSGAVADEPKLALPAPPILATSPEPVIQVQVGVPLLSQIPYVSRLFKSIGPQGDASGAERIGVDFEFTINDNSAEIVTFCPTASHCVRGTPEINLPAFVLTREACAGPNCQGNSCAAVAGSHANVFVTRCATIDGAQPRHHDESMIAHFAALESRSEMLEEIVPLMIEKAKLEAKVEHMAEREKMHKEFAELATANAQLQARVEFQKEQLAMMLQSIKLAQENESLKQRIAELEQRGAPSAAGLAPRPSAIYVPVTPRSP